jgi:hypothetical protein
MIIKGRRHALQASIHSPTLRLSPISLIDEKKEKGGRKEGSREVIVSFFNELDTGKELC